MQVPDGAYEGFTENALFYAGLWSMVAVSLLVTKVATDVLGVRVKEPLYERSFPDPGTKPRPSSDGGGRVKLKADADRDGA